MDLIYQIILFISVQQPGGQKKNPCCLFLVPCKKKTGQELGETLPGDAAQAANERRASVGDSGKASIKTQRRLSDRRGGDHDI